MKKQIQAGIAVLAVVAAVFFSVLTGSKFLEMTAGPVAAGADLGLEKMEGQYITYSVARPIISYAEEYYSGDQSRISKMAYIIYDESRKSFLKIVIPERKKSDFERLLRAANRSEELKKEFGEAQKSDERPIDVNGSLVPFTDTAEIGLIQESMQETMLEDGEEIVNLALAQTKWYVLEDGYVGGIPKANLWICAVVILLNIVAFFLCLFSLLRKGKKLSVSGNSNVDKLMNRQRSWLEPWCEKGEKKRNLQGVLFIFGAAAAVTALGFFVGGKIMEVLTLHLPIGLGIGELCGLPLLLGAGFAFNPDKILKAYQKNLRKEVPIGTDLDILSEDLLGTEAQWSVLEKGKEQIRYGILGERYWMIFGEGGLVKVVDSEQVAEMKTEEVSGQIRSGKVRMNYVYYAVNIKYINSNRKKDWDVAFSFNSEDTAGHFMVLARKRLGDRASQVIQ